MWEARPVLWVVKYLQCLRELRLHDVRGSFLRERRGRGTLVGEGMWKRR